MKSVIVACTLRSGSNLLCELLEKLGYGMPTEFFQRERYQNAESLTEYPASELLTLPQLYEQFVERHDGQSWRGVKWNWSQFHLFKSTIAASEDLAFEKWLPNPVWIRLSRRKRIDQAVSMHIAKKTGVWVNGDTTKPAEKPLAYDFPAIWNEFADFASEEALWSTYLQQQGIEHVEIVYEDLISDYGNQMRRILSVLDPSRVDEISPTDTLPKNIRNIAIGNPKAKELSHKFAADLIARRHMKPNSSVSVDAVMTALTQNVGATLFSKFLGDKKGALTVRKLDLKTGLKINGPSEWVEQPHFLDGVALRLNPGGQAKITTPARRILIEFLSHPWSGTAGISVAAETHQLDLYGVITTRHPWMIALDATQDLELNIAALEKKSALSSGYEVWIQRIWTLAD